MKARDETQKGKERHSIFCNTQVLVATISLLILLVFDSALIFLLRQSPDRIAAAQNPYFGDYFYSLKTELIIFVDVVLFVILFLTTHAILVRLKRTFSC